MLTDSSELWNSVSDRSGMLIATKTTSSTARMSQGLGSFLATAVLKGRIRYARKWRAARETWEASDFSDTKAGIVKRVLVITNNLQQESFRLRGPGLIPVLREHGFELNVQVRPRRIIPRRKLLRSASTYDSVILQRKMLDPMDA